MDRSNRFLTETATMQTLTFSSPRGDAGFKIGLGLVVLFAALEVFFASYHYVGLIRASRAATAAAQPPVVAKAAPRPVATVAPPPAAASPSAPALSADERLLKEAIELNDHGDTATALNRLQQAAEKNPKNAQVFGEMAQIYESAKNYDRSNEMWRKVQEIGPSAGAIYGLADAKLKRGPAATPASIPGPTVAEAPAEAAPAQAPPVAASSDGIPDGSTFGIAEISATETPDADADTNLMLRIGVKKRPTAVVDHTKVKIQVYFYDLVDDKDIKLTDAEVNYEWLTPDHDWAGPKPEVLAVTYVRPKNKARSQESALSEAAAAVNPNKKGRPIKPTLAPDDSGRRKYLGYIVRVYYNDKLQAVRAEPTKLLNLFPPPSTASSP